MRTMSSLTASGFWPSTQPRILPSRSISTRLGEWVTSLLGSGPPGKESGSQDRVFYTTFPPTDGGELFLGNHVLESKCTDVLRRDPAHAGALHVLGIIAAQTGNPWSKFATVIGIEFWRQSGFGLLAQNT